ncbi:hypothetical protein Bca52824_026908 [Brassica carinata]|uniref:Uncharacterized protein n=1 Tax=Brassica carinata TaxID=52824 RepID=A0A8X7SIJ6_BRACI|nr:hypothetical protein Bca52824_026908 [Brassica carinata]
MNHDLPDSFVGGHARLCRLSADPFSSPIASFGTASDAGSEAVPMAPLKQRDCFALNDGPCSKIRERDLEVIRRKYGIHPSVQMRRSGEITIYEAYLVAGFRGIIPPLVAEISSFFALCPSQLTTLSWKILMSIQVLGELHGLDIGVHEVLYSYRFVPLKVTPGFNYLQPRDGAPLVEEPQRGIRSNFSFENNWSGRYVFMKIQEPIHYPTFWRTVDVSRPVSFLGEAVAKKILMIPRHFREIRFLMSKEVLRHSHLWGKSLLLSLVLTMVSSGVGVRPFYSESTTEDTPLVGIQQRLLSELFSLRNRVNYMAAQRDLLIQQVRASTRWELMKEWVEKRTEHWDPLEEYRQHLFWFAGSTPPADRFSRMESRVRLVHHSRCLRLFSFLLFFLDFLWNKDSCLEDSDVNPSTRGASWS